MTWDIMALLRETTTEQMDRHIMETENPPLERGSFMKMVVRHLKSKLENTWRVKFLGDGSVRLTDFSMPANQKNLPDEKCLNEESLPEWVKKRVAVLQICDEGTIIEGVGQRIAENVYYVVS